MNIRYNLIRLDEIEFDKSMNRNNHIYLEFLSLEDEWH